MRSKIHCFPLSSGLWDGKGSFSILTLLRNMKTQLIPTALCFVRHSMSNMQVKWWVNIWQIFLDAAGLFFGSKHALIKGVFSPSYKASSSAVQPGKEIKAGVATSVYTHWRWIHTVNSLISPVGTKNRVISGTESVLSLSQSQHLRLFQSKVLLHTKRRNIYTGHSLQKAEESRDERQK